MSHVKKALKAGTLAAMSAAATAAAAGALFLYGTKEGKKVRKKVTSLALKVKGEVLEELERARDASEQAYHGAIGKVVRKYGALKNIDQKELASLARELKSHWAHIRRHAHRGTRTGVRAARHVVRAARSSVRKAVRS